MISSGMTLHRLALVVPGAWLAVMPMATGRAQPPALGVAGGQWLDVQEVGACGSEFETMASTTEGSNQIVVADVGDFEIGQGVMISKAFVHYEKQRLWGPDWARSQPLEDAVEIRGYDGTSGSWTAFLLEIYPDPPAKFRFSDDIGRTWSEKLQITGDWQPLSGGTEVKFNRLQWDGGYAVSFSARDQLLSVIEKIEGNTITLREAPNRTVQDALVRHCDSLALQAAVDRAVREKRHLYFPPGRYRLAQGLVVNEPTAITIQGADPVNTIVDISWGEGACFSFRGGHDVTLRNFRLEGHTGYDRRDQCGSLRMPMVPAMWGMYLKGCNAVSIRDTERVLVENCHARKMATECFYSQGRSRQGTQEPAQYTKEITYLRCSCEDCGRNAFNNNDMCENTSVLYCRIRDVGGCSWEGASRYVKFIGNYVRNGGTVAMGNIGSRAEHFETLGSGQHIVADNVFETGVCYGGCAIRAAHGANQVIIRSNIFVNYGTSAIELMGRSTDRHLPARNCMITGNIMDMTSVEGEPRERYAIQVSASGAVVSDNQIYVRGECDPTVSGIRLYEPAVNLQVRDNMISNCGYGVATGRCRSSVSKVMDRATFIPLQSSFPFEWRRSHRYRGWQVSWMNGDTHLGLSTIEDHDPETLQFRLSEPRAMKAGDDFELFPGVGANWDISGNIVTGCLHPVVLDSYGSATSIFRDNTLSRGEVIGVQQAAEVRGWFKLIGCHFCGFDEEGSSALGLYPDRAGRDVRSAFIRNIFERCANVVAQGEQGLWEGSHVEGNLFLECGSTPR
jgi:hypothetical protein